MGVYMSSLLQLPFTKKIAFCGTGNPIDAGEGIAPKIYTLTIDSFSEKNASPVFQKNRFRHGYEPFRNRIAARTYCDTRL